MQQDSTSGWSIAVAPRYRHCSGATFTVAVAPLLLVEKNGDGSAANFSLILALRATATFELRQCIFWVPLIVLELTVNAEY